jgi:DNA-directed RNA polymerase subunit H (RpoH/RPB5)
LFKSSHRRVDSFNTATATARSLHLASSNKQKQHNDTTRMDWSAYCEALGRVKQNQVRMMRTRGAAVPPHEVELLDKEPKDVVRMYMHTALERGVSVFKAMSGVYERFAHGGIERTHVVFVGARFDAALRIKAVSIDALRTAIADVRKAEGDEAFDDAVTLAYGARRRGALQDALATHTSSLRDTTAESASASQKRARPANAAKAMQPSRKRKASIVSCAKGAHESIPTDVQGSDGGELPPQPQPQPQPLSEQQELQSFPLCASCPSPSCPSSLGLGSSPAPLLSPPHTATAIFIVPSHLTSDTAKEAARAAEWATVFSHAELAVPLGEHPDTPEHVFVRGHDAAAALAALGTDFQDMPVLRSDDIACKYFGGRSGDVARVERGEGVVDWLAVV